MRGRLGSAVVFLLALVTLASCAPSDEPSAPVVCTGAELIVAAGARDDGSLVCSIPGCVEGPDTTGVDLGKDPMLALSNGRAFFLARDEDVLFELDATCGTPTSRIEALRGLVPPGVSRANPHDAAAAPDGTVVVPLYNVPTLAFIKNEKLAGSIDLSKYDPDGNPQADAVSIVTVNDAAKAFVTLERLDDDGIKGEYLRSKQPSYMLRVDVASQEVEAVIQLAGRNPFNPMAELHGALFMAEPGNFDTADDEFAGIERFDTQTSSTRILVQERHLGGSVTEVAVTDGCGVAIVAGPQPMVNPTAVVSFDPETGKLFTTMAAAVLGPTPGFDLQGLAWSGRTLYVGDRRRSANGYTVHVLERDEQSCALHDTGRVIDVPRQPIALRASKK